MEIISNLLTGGEILAILYFFWRFRGQLLNGTPDIDDLCQDIDELHAQVTEFKSKQNTFHEEIFDYVDGVLTPMSKRMNQRNQRAKQKDLSNEETISKGGIIPIPRNYGDATK